MIREDPNTQSSRPIIRPFKVGLRNSILALTPVMILTIVNYLYLHDQFNKLNSRTTGETGSVTFGLGEIWMAGIVMLAIPLVCFSQAYLGSRTTGKFSSRVMAVILIVILLVIVYSIRGALLSSANQE